MSIRIRSFAPLAVLATSFGFMLSFGWSQQKPEDLLNRAKGEQSILTQKLEGTMRNAQADARRLQATSPIRAANMLKSAIAQLDDPLIPPAFRADWTAKLSTQIKLIESGKRLPDPVADVSPEKREIKEAQIKRAHSMQEEYYDVRRSVETIAALVKSGNTTQAQKETEALSKRYPNNPVVISMNENVAWNQRLADAKEYVETQKQGYLLAMRNVDRSAIPPKEDLEFDVDYFKKISKLRIKPQFTAKEIKILRALETPITLGYKDTPFEEVIKFISTKMGVPILLDKSALQDAMIQTNTPVTIDLPSGVSTRTALRKLLMDQNLTFIMKDETLQVVTIGQARSMLTTRVYPIGDIVQMVGPFGGAVTWGPWMDMAQTQEAVKQLIQSVQSIDPLSWKEAGGNGTITFHWPTLSLIVRQTTEMHAKLGGLSR